MIILIILGVPKVREVDAKRAKRMKRMLIRNSIIMIIPSILVAYLMVHDASKDENTLTGFDTSVSVKALSDELNVLYPEIASVSVGQLDELDENGEPVQKKVILLRTAADTESADFQEHFTTMKKWLEVKYEGYEIKLESVN